MILHILLYYNMFIVMLPMYLKKCSTFQENCRNGSSQQVIHGPNVANFIEINGLNYENFTYILNSNV